MIEEGAYSCQTLTKKLKTGSTLPEQTGTSSSHGSSSTGKTTEISVEIM